MEDECAFRDTGLQRSKINTVMGWVVGWAIYRWTMYRCSDLRAALTAGAYANAECHRIVLCWREPRVISVPGSTFFEWSMLI